MQYIKIVVGLDISMATFVARFGTVDTMFQQTISSAYTFSNDLKGFKKLISWTKKMCQGFKLPHDSEIQFVMEATGVYYENLAYFLADENKFVCVMLPNKARNYSKTLDIKSKTDEIDAATLTQFGLERTLKRWETPSTNFKKLKELSREHQNLKRQTTAIRNQLHAKKHSHNPVKEIVKRLNEQLKFYNKQIKQIEKEIKDLIQRDDDLNSKIKKIQTIKGAGLMTIVSILAETNGFALIKNAKQLTSYSGLDIVHKQSGKYEGKTHISKKGNKFIRTAVYMSALSACRWNNKFNIIYNKLIARKNSKKLGIVAIARKLLILIYTLWKNNTEYNHNYQCS
jgi:transposase